MKQKTHGHHKITFEKSEARTKQIIDLVIEQNKAMRVMKKITVMLWPLSVAAAIFSTLVCIGINNISSTAKIEMPTILIASGCALVCLLFVALCLLVITKYFARKHIILRQDEKIALRDNCLNYSHKERRGPWRGKRVSYSIDLDKLATCTYNATTRKMVLNRDTSVVKVSNGEHGVQEANGSKALTVYDYYEPSLHLALTRAGVVFDKE